MTCFRSIARGLVLASAACGPEVARDEPAPRVLVEQLVDGCEQIWLFDAEDSTAVRIDPPSATGHARSVCGIGAQAFCVRSGQGDAARMMLLDPRFDAPIDVTAVHHGERPSAAFFLGDSLIHTVGDTIYELDVVAAAPHLRRLLGPPSPTSWIWSEVRVSSAGTWLAAPISTGLRGRSWDLLLARRSDGSTNVVELGAAPGTAIVQPQLPEFAADEQVVFAVGNSDAQTSAVVVDLSDGHARALALPSGLVVQRMAPGGDLVAWGVDGDVFVLPALGGAPGDPRRLTAGPLRGRADVFALGPDSRWVLVEMRAEAGTLVSVIEVATGAAFELGRAAPPIRFSADGTALSFASDDGLQLVDLAGPVPIAAPIAAPFDEAEIAPDGESVALVRERTLEVATREGDVRTIFVADEGTHPYAPRFSRDGAWLSWELVRETPEGFVEPAGVWMAAWAGDAAPIEIAGARRRLALLEP